MPIQDKKPRGGSRADGPLMADRDDRADAQQAAVDAVEATREAAAPAEGARLIWCAEHPTTQGPFTRQELSRHLGPDGPHGHMMANGAGPPWNRKKENVA